ncbi:ankyrin repeat domain-containing protein [Acaryochloris sp. IP29b_bin.137]|uniref:ankyrin repeat domain-containing protein n=1 Tax=Acaryochloris sp. IP29b_bin.137 TaxID=2969217 RepID=UPI00260A2421|nr:ankyrin repeat domain-containing protein [Acaryochloris sp. IP29b_bin.137]
MNDKPRLWLPKVDERGITELHYAAYCQDLVAVRYWVGQGCDVNQKTDTGWTPLVWCIDMAATGGVGVAESIVDYLIEHGAQLEYKDDQYSSLLEFAYSRDSAVAMHLEKVIRE